jgi:ribosomal-protein-alanine N-acetyltransferase
MQASEGQQRKEPAPHLQFMRIKHQHIDAIYEIEQEAYPEPWTRNMFRQEVQSPLSYFYVAFLGDEIVGYVGFWRALDEAHITSVTVRQEYRGRGFGKILVEYIIAVARELGLLSATLEVRASNHVAQHLYTKMGFHQIGRRTRYYSKTGEDALVMARDIEPLQTDSANSK